MDTHPEVEGDLGGEVRVAAEPVKPEPTARPDPAAAQGAVADDPGAEQRSRADVVQGLRQGVDVSLVGDARVRIPAVDVRL